MIRIVLMILGLLYVYLLVMFSFALIYIFQIKEYRFDRLYSQIKEEGPFSLVVRNFGKRPALSARNALILCVSIVIFLILSLMLSQTYAMAQEGSETVFFTIMAVVLFLVNPAVAAASVVGGVLATQPLATYKRNALIDRAKFKVQKSHAVFIGISGTYGKSTTKEYLYHILSKKYKVGKTDENMNTDVGVAVSILKNLHRDTEYFVAEVGAYKLGEVRRAAVIFSPRAAIMLPFGNQHIDLYGSKENLVAAESEIVDLIPLDGKVYVNADIPELDYVKSHTRGVIRTYSIINKDADIYADDIEVNGEGSSARVHFDDKSFKIHTKLLGTHVIHNLLPAIAASHYFGMRREDIIAAIADLEYIPGKLSVHRGKNNSILLNDSGNSSLNGFLAGIDTIKLFKKPYTYILSKGIIELGSEKEESYKKIIMQLEKDNLLLATSDKLFKKLKKNHIVTIVRSEADFEKYIVPKLGPQTAVLFEGKFTKNFLEKFI